MEDRDPRINPLQQLFDQEELSKAAVFSPRPIIHLLMENQRGTPRFIEVEGDPLFYGCIRELATLRDAMKRLSRVLGKPIVVAMNSEITGVHIVPTGFSLYQEEPQ